MDHSLAETFFLAGKAMSRLVGPPTRISECFSPTAANQECCHKSGLSSAGDVRALGIITMLLMQKYHSNNGDLGIEDTQRWPLDSDAVQFLTELSAEKPVQKLMKVRDVLLLGNRI